MDPDEDNGAVRPQLRESRRLRNLDPPSPFHQPPKSHSTQSPVDSIRNANLNPPLSNTEDHQISYQIPTQINVEDASLSQYDTAHNTTYREHPSSNQSIVSMNIDLSSTTRNSHSNDPPEDVQSNTSSLLSYSHPRNPSSGNTTTLQHTTNSNVVPPSHSSKTSSITLPSTEKFNQEKNTYESFNIQLQSMTADIAEFKRVTTNNQIRVDSCIQNLTQTTTKIADSTLALHSNINEVKSTLQTYESNLQTSITNAIVAAMQQIQVPSAPTNTPCDIPTQHPSATIPTSVQNQIPSPICSSTSNQTPFQPIVSNPPITANTIKTSNCANPAVIDLTSLSTLLQNHTTPSSKQFFPTFHKKDDFFSWRSLCILELSSSRSSFYNDFITFNSEGIASFKQDMSCQQNRELFKITRHALSTTLDTTFITTDCITSANGLNLWKTLEQRYRPLPKDEIEKIDFQTEFTKLSRNSNETHENFLIRFEKFVSEMAYFHMKPSTLHQVLVFLDGLQEPLLGDPICTIRQDPKSIYANWIVADNLQHTLQKAKSFIKQKQKYIIVPPSSRLGGKRKKSDNPPSEQSTDQPFEIMKTKFTSALKNAENPLDTIFDFRNKNRRGCYFHGDKHKFFKCRLVENICETHGFTDKLKETIR